MTRILKEFIEDHVSLFEQEEFYKIFEAAHNESLLNFDVLDLEDIVLQLFKNVDTQSIRSNILFDTLNKELDNVRQQYSSLDSEEMRIIETHAALFLRKKLNNTLGYFEREALEFMRDNQAALRIKLTPVTKVAGQSGINNYKIEYLP